MEARLWGLHVEIHRLISARGQQRTIAKYFWDGVDGYSDWKSPMSKRVWYRIHPAFGLHDQPTAGFAPCLTDAQLGIKWDGFGDDERARRERDFYAYVLTYLALTYQPKFEVELPCPTERDTFLRHAETPSRPVGSRPEDFVLTGTLTAGAAECLAELNPVSVTMRVDDELVFTLGDAWSSATIALWPEEAVELRRELERLSLVSD